MNDLAFRILSRLHTARTYLSGEDLSGEFGISRSAVWKHICRLRDAGCRIEAVTGSGYRLIALSGAPDGGEVALFLTTRAAGRVFHYHKETASTNLLAKKLAAEGAPEGTVVAADTQSAGRGRLGRSWISPAGRNLYFSLILRPSVASLRIPQITLLAAAAIHRALCAAFPSINAGIKWPNDILCGGRKLCGVLCEMQSEPGLTHFVVVGIGINVNQESFPEELQEKATSLRLETGAGVSRSELLAGALNRFEDLYLQWQEEDDLGFILPYLERYSLLQGMDVIVDQFSRQVAGKVCGIACGGELVLQTEDGSRLNISSGEASLRNTYTHL
ncbi:MAG: biotin--[acetyl-CoA-carboxylase] ligase [Chlorobium sp.]|uniref:biotin--[acetyl-CoA-carboxylase] ligase n=1 Tax=Chlorobium sp. TaxID=1095 RepID=UPI0025C17ACA|nr:biotin--[acetyl-CoA-carboxylase] ligase [Chlorobium sp.]MCF8383788.1 biotin--[acetyl-CoA-carboxylase] ligase [Chlorobium sp.]